MAHLRQLAALTDELVTAVCGDETDRQHAQRRDSTLGALKQNPYGRTDHFDVQHRLQGLEERFLVVGRDALAHALRKRMDALEPHTTKWTPEVLHFLLELSYQPAQKSRIQDLENLLAQKQKDADSRPALTWAVIAKDEGWDQDDGLWQTVNFADSSQDEESGEDNCEASGEEKPESTGASSFELSPQKIRDLGVGSGNSDEVLGQGEDVLRQVEESQKWRGASPPRDMEGRPKKTSVSSLQVLRDCLFMLRGLETSLFDAAYGLIANYQLLAVSWETHKALLTSFAEYGRKLAPLRTFALGRQDMALLQALQNSVQITLQRFDRRVADMETRFVAVKQDVLVSLIGVLEELKPALAPLLTLANIVRQLQEERHPHAFRYLELLFDAAAVAQSVGSDSTYLLLGTIFFDCFQVYLRPIRTWMEEGALVPGDRTFFVVETATQVPLRQLWTSQFKLLHSKEGALHAPRFLQPAVRRIFCTGKSIVVLKHLGHYDSAKVHWQDKEPEMTFSSVAAGDVVFAPFADIFSQAFDRWIQSKHHGAAMRLRDLLFRSCRLSKGIDALQSIYLMADGSMSDAFSHAVFRHLDSLSPSWKDGFVLTEIAQEAFSACGEVFRLSGRLDPQGLVDNALTARSSVRCSLPAIRLSYQLGWLLQMVIPESAMYAYQRVFTFLLQIRRAVFVLHKRHPSVLRKPVATTDHQGAYYALRSRLVWFVHTLTSYMTSLVIAPCFLDLRAGLASAMDVDDMISVHATFMDRLLAGACLGAKLGPIKECVLDVLDLTIRLEDAHRAEVRRRAAEADGILRLSAVGSPLGSPSATLGEVGRGSRLWSGTARGCGEEEAEEDGWEDEPKRDALLHTNLAEGSTTPYDHALVEVRRDFERHLRFIASGLRGVSRASRDEAAGRNWDLLSEMLEVGIQDQGYAGL